jgi:single-strand DNA-binding protein
MSKGLNKVFLIGRLGENPTIRYTAGGTAVANMSVATNYSVKQNEEWIEKVEWNRCQIWGKTAEACGEYLSKGSQVYIEGRLSTRSWDDKEGVKRWATEIVAQDVIFLDSKGGGKSDRPPTPPVDEESQGQSGGYNASEENKGDEEFGGMEEDVPF